MRSGKYDYPGLTREQVRRMETAEDKILRLARIQNGKEPGYENGHPKKPISVAGK